jgi:hypothetical protein
MYQLFNSSSAAMNPSHWELELLETKSSVPVGWLLNAGPIADAGAEGVLS